MKVEPKSSHSSWVNESKYHRPPFNNRMTIALNACKMCAQAGTICILINDWFSVKSEWSGILTPQDALIFIHYRMSLIITGSPNGHYYFISISIVLPSELTGST